MSTPQLSSKHFSTVSRSLVHYTTLGRTSLRSPLLAAELCRALGITPHSDDHQDAQLAVSTLAFDLQRLNSAAHKNRYRTTTVIDAPKRGALLKLPALLKALYCIRCNCDGGQFQGALTTLEAVIEAIEYHIISTLKEYEEAEWFL